MKKAQILSAIALAFALGVVAPVAGVFAADPTVDQIQDTATKTELTNAIANASNNKAVAAYKTMQTATATGKTWTDIDEDDLMGDINDAIAAVYAGGVNGVEAPENYKAAETLADAVKNAEGIKNLIPQYQALIAAVNNTANPASYDELVVLANNAGLKVTLPEGSDKNASTLRTAISTNAIYVLYNDLNTALTTANTKVQEQKDHVDDLSAALAYADDVITAKMIQDALKDESPVDELVKLAGTALASAQGLKYIAVLDEITTAQGVADNASATGEQYASALKALNADFKAATGAALSVGTPVNNPDDETNNGSNAGDDTKDPSAPGTGLVSTAEGNAATTVSIVAGLATALTALGAGVVAYRSARRSNK